MKKVFFWTIILGLSYSCKSKVVHVEKAFYYWKSGEWRMDENDKAILDEFKTEKLYVKFFEIEHNELMGNIPISKNKMRVYR